MINLNNIGNYARHAQFWDWSGHDRSAEHKFWGSYAAKYGKNVLIPMCAWGDTGAYMAEQGFCVTAFDITPEMIAEGRKRHGNIPGLQLFEGDVTNFSFDIAPVDFCYCVDLGHIHTIEKIKDALTCINKHMRKGGGLVIETGLPSKESSQHPFKTFHPIKQVYPNMKVWKTGDGHTDAKTGRHYINQIFYCEHTDGSIESFNHEFYLQSYHREEWLKIFDSTGFEVKGEYKNREYEPWCEEDMGWMVELIKE